VSTDLFREGAPAGALSSSPHRGSRTFANPASCSDAQTLAQVVLGWYSHALDDAEAVREIESALRSHGADDLLVPSDDWPEAHS